MRLSFTSLGPSGSDLNRRVNVFYILIKDLLHLCKELLGLDRVLLAQFYSMNITRFVLNRLFDLLTRNWFVLITLQVGVNELD